MGCFSKSNEIRYSFGLCKWFFFSIYVWCVHVQWLRIHCNEYSTQCCTHCLDNGWRPCWTTPNNMYCQTSSICRTWEGNKIVDHSDVVGASNLIFILDLTPGFNRLDKGNCKTRRETFVLGFGAYCSRDFTVDFQRVCKIRNLHCPGTV